MRLARKLMLLALTATAITALAAPSAFAQGSETEPLAYPTPSNMRVFQEDGAQCTAVSPGTPPVGGTFGTSGGCLVHGGGQNIVFSGHLFGIESVDSTCNVEFDLRTNGIANGYLVHQEFTQGTQGTCTRRPCHQPVAPGEEPPVSGQGEGRPWRGFARESATAPRERITVLFCVENRHTAAAEQNRRHCNVTVPFSGEAAQPHHYVFTANDINASGTPRCELSGTFESEAVQMQPAGSEPGRTQVEIFHP